MSVLPTNVYPPVSWLCDDVVKVAQELFESHGFSVTLGYGSEVVKVVRLGTGATLSTTGRFIGSETLDPKLRPQYVMNCFQPSVWQLRLKLEAVGQENGVWVPIDSLSYKPAGGWEVTPPYSLPQLKVLSLRQYKPKQMGTSVVPTEFRDSPTVHGTFLTDRERCPVCLTSSVDQSGTGLRRHSTRLFVPAI